MATFFYRVQGYAPEQTLDDHDTWEAVTCLACQCVHLVNLVTGRVLGEDEWRLRASNPSPLTHSGDRDRPPLIYR